MGFKYTRVCVKCGDSKQVGYKPKEGCLCYKCSNVINGRKMGSVGKKRKVDLIRYTYLCPNCPAVRVLKNRSSPYCQKCAPKFTRIKMEASYFDMKNMITVPPRYFRVCHKCGDIAEVKSKQSAQKRLCRSCKKPKGKNHHKKKYVCKEAIERVKEANRKHKAEVEANRLILPEQKITDEEMIAQWLKCNEVKQCNTTEPMEVDRYVNNTQNVQGL